MYVISFTKLYIVTEKEDLTDLNVERTGKQHVLCRLSPNSKFMFSVPVHIGLYITLFAKGLTESVTNSSVRPIILCLQIYTII
jgi:hypothetical protein